VTGGGAVWWGEAADEPAREDARRTDISELYRRPAIRNVENTHGN